MGWMDIQRKIFERVDSGISGFVNRSQNIFKDMPHAAGQVEIEHIAVVKFGDVLGILVLLSNYMHIFKFLF